MFLSRYAGCVRVLVRGSSLAASMSSYLTSRLEADPGITIEYNSEVTALEGGEHLESVTIRNAETGQSRKVAARSLFIMVGAAPNTEWLSGLVKLDDKGFVVTGLGLPASPFATSYPGIFAVGDVRAGSVKRVASAVGEGSVVISKVWEHVKQNTMRCNRRIAAALIGISDRNWLRGMSGDKRVVVSPRRCAECVTSAV
jgi:thioredoxin reductase (NADPH)